MFTKFTRGEEGGRDFKTVFVLNIFGAKVYTYARGMNPKTPNASLIHITTELEPYINGSFRL